jgi:hypothetical protein
VYAPLPAGGGAYTVQSFLNELDDALIVAGTADDAAANREAALALQEAIRVRWSNLSVPIRTDAEVTDDELKAKHVLLVGRPAANRVAERFAKAFPVRFGPQSFGVGKDAYAHANSLVVAAGANPLNPRYSAVVLAGNGGDATYHAPGFVMKGPAAEVLVGPAHEKVKPMVVSKGEKAAEAGGGR